MNKNYTYGQKCNEKQLSALTKTSLWSLYQALLNSGENYGLDIDTCHNILCENISRLGFVLTFESSVFAANSVENCEIPPESRELIDNGLQSLINKIMLDV